MESEVITVDRNTLYEQVWNTPMWKLAINYGFSDVGLAKICRKLNIPLPPRGYWQKNEVGKATSKPSLPEITNPQLSKVTIPIKKPKAERLSENAMREMEFEKSPNNKIVVPDTLSRLHPILKPRVDALRNASPDDYGVVSSEESHSLNLRVSKAQLPRALRILNALYHALESRGFLLEKTADDSKQYQVAIHGEHVKVAIEEKVQRFERKEKNRKDSNKWWYYQRYEFRPTGMLSLRIKEYLNDGLRQTWGDGKKQKVENLLNDFIGGLVEAAEDLKAKKLERERWHREWQEEEQRRKEIERKRVAEQKRIQQLEKDAADWAKAKQIQEYLAELKLVLFKKDGEIFPDSKVDVWFSWAQRHAKQLNPMTRVVDTE